MNQNRFFNEARAFNFCKGNLQDPSEFYLLLVEKILDEFPILMPICILTKKTIYNCRFSNNKKSCGHKFELENLYSLIPIQGDNLQRSINDFFYSGVSNGNFWCDECSMKTSGTEAFQFELPKIICFYFHNPLRVRLGQNLIINQRQYKIEVFIIRNGSNNNFGHFYAICLEGTSIFQYDDSYVSQESKEEFISCMIYCRQL